MYFFSMFNEEPRSCKAPAVKKPLVLRGASEPKPREKRRGQSKLTHSVILKEQSDWRISWLSWDSSRSLSWGIEGLRTTLGVGFLTEPVLSQGEVFGMTLHVKLLRRVYTAWNECARNDREIPV